MKIRFYSNAIVTTFVLCLAFFLAGPNTAFAATSPSLGLAATYGVIADTFTLNAGAPPFSTVITGDIGYITLSVGGLHTNGAGWTEVGPSAGYTAIQVDQEAAKDNLVDGINTQVLASCTSLGLAGVNLNNAPGHLTGVYTPGCYKSGGAMNITTGTTVTLSGAGTYIFKPTGALTTEDNTFVTLANGASSCDVFWVPTGGTTLGAYTTGGVPPLVPTFIGNIFHGDAAGLSITLGHWAHLLGRVLATSAAGSTFTGNDNTIDSTCTTAPSGGGGGGGRRVGTITVVKTVINDNGGTKMVSDFPLFVDGTSVVSGVTNEFTAPADAYTVTETSNSNYTRTFSGDCDASGKVGISPGDAAVCIVTNNDIGAPVVVPPVPPLIDVVKVPSPLSLPGGPGMVEYTYTLTNVGIVPVTDITMVGDTCSPIVLASGDTNSNGKLEVTETWKYTCTTNLTETHTNIVTTTGWANGISAIDIARATVIVGKSTVHPLIHVTKIPKPLTLPVEGGMVTYTKKVTNPGTVPLSDVTLTDDKCASVKFVSGDTNHDSKLDPTETWTYTCKESLKKTTTNTAIAKGEANGFTVRDFAVATVVVATGVPKLPNTGVFPMGNLLVWPVVALSILAVSIILLSVILKKKPE